MKKVFSPILGAILVVCLTSCGAGWSTFKKDIKSDLDGGLNRTITVTNMITGEQVWTYTGKSYISDKSTNGDVTVIYYVDGEPKKADFIGSCYGVCSFEN